MSFLSDQEILSALSSGAIQITPFEEIKLGSCYYEFGLASTLLKLQNGQRISFAEKPTTIYDEIQMDGTYLLQPKEFIIAHSAEQIALDSSIAVVVDGRPSLAKVGISVHQSSAFCKPNQGLHTVTLEVFNASDCEIEVYTGMKFGKFLFMSITH